MPQSGASPCHGDPTVTARHRPDKGKRLPVAATSWGDRFSTCGLGGDIVLQLSAAAKRWGGSTLVTDAIGRPSSRGAIERGVRATRGTVKGLPAGFRFHDLRHYFASLLIAAGLDVKVVQTRLRHASAVTTLNTYGHMFPDKDESARAAVAAALAARADSVRTQGVVTAL